MGTVLITPRSLTRERHPAFSLIENAGHTIVTSTPGVQPSEEELLRLVPDIDGYLAGVETIGAKVLEAAKNLKVIGRNGIGIDNIDIETAKRLNIKICPTPGANARGVAELAVALLFSLSRAIPYSDAQLKTKNWEAQKRNGAGRENPRPGRVRQHRPASSSRCFLPRYADKRF